MAELLLDFLRLSLAGAFGAAGIALIILAWKAGAMPDLSPIGNEATAMSYAGIAKATLLIALDNGGINRGRSAERQRRDLAKFLAKRPDDLLAPIDQWLLTLSEQDMETVCCGEHSEAQAILADAPPFTDDLLNEYFEEVC